MSATESGGADRTIVHFPASEDYRSVGRLVVGGIASRFELPVDRVDDLVLAIESVFMQHAAGSSLELVADATPEDLKVTIGPLLLADLEDASVQRVLSRLVDSVATRPEGEQAWIELTVAATYRRAEA